MKLVSITIDKAVLTSMTARRRNQLVGCMHSANELAMLNRFLLFAMTEVGADELSQCCYSNQTWTTFQILAGKIFISWEMICKRFLASNPPDVIIAKINEKSLEAFNGLSDYFGVKGGQNTWNDCSIKFVRDKNAFHYDNLDLSDSASNFGPGENVIYLGDHPVNSLYWAGSALVFRSVFYKIGKAKDGEGFQEVVNRGWKTFCDDMMPMNYNISILLNGLIEALLEDALGYPPYLSELTEHDVITVNSDNVKLPLFLDMRAL